MFLVPISYYEPKYGTAIRDEKNINTSINTNGDCLLIFFNAISRRIIPIQDPNKLDNATKNPYCIFSISFIIYVIVDAPVENIIIYIPDADATFGGTLRLNNNGLNIAPPPSPNAPETHPPRSEKTTKYTRVLPYNGISLFANPLPYLIFNFYSN